MRSSGGPGSISTWRGSAATTTPPTLGRPSIAPGVYFRCFLVGSFEGMDSERIIAYRIADSLSLRELLGLSLEEPTPDQSALSKRGDPQSLMVMVAEAGSVVTQMAGQAAEADAVGPVKAVSEVGVERVVADKGYPSKQLLEELAEVGVRSVIAEPQRERQCWVGQRAAQTAVYANRRRLKTARGQALMRRRGVLMERTFAHLYDTGGLRRVPLRGKDNIAKRLLIHAAAFHLSLILRELLGVGTARQAADLLAALCF